LHNSRRAELNEALIWLGKVKWGSRSSPLRNAGTYATIYSAGATNGWVDAKGTFLTFASRYLKALPAAQPAAKEQ